MAVDIITRILTLMVLILVTYLVGYRYIRFRRTDPIDTRKVLVILALLCSIAHTIRLLLGYTQGYFFTIAVLCVVYVAFKDWVVALFVITKDWIRQKLRI